MFRIKYEDNPLSLGSLLNPCSQLHWWHLEHMEGHKLGWYHGANHHMSLDKLFKHCSGSGKGGSRRFWSHYLLPCYLPELCKLGDKVLQLEQNQLRVLSLALQSESRWDLHFKLVSHGTCLFGSFLLFPCSCTCVMCTYVYTCLHVYVHICVKECKWRSKVDVSNCPPSLVHRVHRNRFSQSNPELSNVASLSS